MSNNNSDTWKKVGKENVEKLMLDIRKSTTILAKIVVGSCFPEGERSEKIMSLSPIGPEIEDKLEELGVEGPLRAIFFLGKACTLMEKMAELWEVDKSKWPSYGQLYKEYAEQLRPMSKEEIEEAITHVEEQFGSGAAKVADGDPMKGPSALEEKIDMNWKKEK